MKAMSWSQEKRCLHCGTRLPLHRKVVDEQFCSDDHRRAFRVAQDQLALQGLHQTGQFIAASSQHAQAEGGGDFRRAEGSVAVAPDGNDRVEDLHELAGQSPAREYLETLPAPHALAQLDESSRAMSAAFQGSAQAARDLKRRDGEPELVNEFFVVLSPAEPGVARAALNLRNLSLQNQDWLESDELFISLCSLPPEAAPDGEPCGDLQPLVKLPAQKLLPGPAAGFKQRSETVAAWIESETATWSVIAPVLACPPGGGILAARDGQLQEILAGPCALPLGLGKPLPASQLQQKLSPLAPAELLLALDLLTLPLRGGPEFAGAIRSGIAAERAFAKSALAPAMGAEASAFQFSPVLMIPEPDLMPQAGGAEARMLALRWPMRRAEMPIRVLEPAAGNAASLIVPFRSEPDPEVARPGLKLATFCPEMEKNRLRGALAFWTASRGSVGGVNPLRLAADFWQNAPRDLKLLAIAIPLLLALVFRPSLPRIHFASKAGARAAETLASAGANESAAAVSKSGSRVPTVSVALGGKAVSPAARVADAATVVTLAQNPLTKNQATDDSGNASGNASGNGANAGSNAGFWGTGLLSHFAGLQQTLAERAGVELDEDFRSGLDDWQTEADPAAAWSFDETGFVRPSSMALYRPSLGLKDYDVQFLAMLDKKALSWVVRARDFRNYYAVKLVVLKGGPAPILGLERYPVIDGHAGKHVQTPVRLNVQKDTLYRVGMNIHDDTFLVTVQGAVIDSWSDETLNRGGIGFFTAAGEASRLRWVQVSHQYDILGRLCAYFAPPGSQSTN